ncbi:MAG: nuclear transport factor 2 family protein [Cyclobacteriaceae bacterium]
MSNDHQRDIINIIIDRYCQVWNESDLSRKATLLASVWAEDATYTDPTVHTTGANELLSHIAKVQDKRPGARVIRTTNIDMHHGVARFNWQIIEADGSARPEGLDLVFLSPNNEKIDRIIGFFGPLSPV